MCKDNQEKSQRPEQACRPIKAGKIYDALTAFAPQDWSARKVMPGVLSKELQDPWTNTQASKLAKRRRDSCGTKEFGKAKSLQTLRISVSCISFRFALYVEKAGQQFCQPLGLPSQILRVETGTLSHRRPATFRRFLSSNVVTEIAGRNYRIPYRTMHHLHYLTIFLEAPSRSGITFQTMTSESL